MAEYEDVDFSKLLRKQMLAGGLAGMLADACVYPMMTVKSRLMVSFLNFSVKDWFFCV